MHKVRSGDESWDEIHSADGEIRAVYRPLVEMLDGMPRRRLIALDEKLEATMREMGVTFDISRERPWGRRPWLCDLLPQIFEAAEWKTVKEALRQRLKAAEFFLRDIYGPKEILRSETLPVQPVLGSPFFQRVACGLPRPDDAFLHLSGAAICRKPDGSLAFKHHYFSNASGIAYMIQNRRALARVAPEEFWQFPIRSIADVPGRILETMKRHSPGRDPTAVLLSPGGGSAAFSEHSFLARRMGIPLVQGNDLVVLGDSVYLKTVVGLEKVEIIYTRLSDPWLDPLAFRRDSLLGVPGLVNCIRRGTVAMMNAIGSQLVDDRALLPYFPAIIRYYLGEQPVLKNLDTFWLGDLDQLELVLSDLASHTIRPLYGEKILLGGDGQRPTRRQVESARKEILAAPHQFVAQSGECNAWTLCYHDGKRSRQRQDHILFALRTSEGNYRVLPGALTRTTNRASRFTANELGGGSKDSWVESTRYEASPVISALADHVVPSAHVSSRTAESLYWMGRYLERAYSLAGMVRVIDGLEVEELNPTERTLYRPIWNQILPPLENPTGVTRRTISSITGRYRLAMDPEEPDSVTETVRRAVENAESILEVLSLEAWGVIDDLRNKLRKAGSRSESSPTRMINATRQVCDEAVSRIPEFFATAESTMIADGAWAFCRIGQHLERAIISANALHSLSSHFHAKAADSPSPQDAEIALSAFLRLLSSRDVYRRVYQMRISLGPLLAMLWTHPLVPRSVLRCLQICTGLLEGAGDLSSKSTRRTVSGIHNVVGEVRKAQWEDWQRTGRSELSVEVSRKLLGRVLDLHTLIADGFLNHQILIHNEAHPTLFGPKYAL